jgi:glycine cleavage system H lipoate-binding protein/predicted peroxiredoxin
VKTHEFAFPDNPLYLVEHDLWARLLGDGAATVGITSLGIKLSGEIYMCRGKPTGSIVDQGRAVAVVELAKAIVLVKSPVSGELVLTNPLLDTTPQPVHRDPYGNGWIARVRLHDLQHDMRRLVQSDAIALDASAGAIDGATRVTNVGAQGLAILLWASEPESPHRLVTPFFHAAAAAAFDIPVEVYFTARRLELLRPGVASSLRAFSHSQTVYDCMKEAVAHGTIFFACSDALHANELDAGELIPECTRRGGALQFMARAIDLHWRTLVF